MMRRLRIRAALAIRAIRARRRALRDQSGVAIILVLSFMALAVPVTAGALTVASTLSTDSQVKTETALDQYTLIGATQHAVYRMLYEEGYAESIPLGGQDTYSITLNGESVDVTVGKSADPPTDPDPAWETEYIVGIRPMQVLKVVTPTTTPALTLTTFEYTLSVQNLSSIQQWVWTINDGLPPGFTYVPGSVSGLTTADPAVVNHTDGDGPYDELIWDVTFDFIFLDPGELVTLTFQATATAPEGTYCNEAWVTPFANQTHSGQTAKIVVGSPALDVCAGESLKVTKTVSPNTGSALLQSTFTYTIEIKNDGATDLNVQKVTDLLPLGLDYVNGTTGGDMVSSDPSVVTMFFSQRKRLRWSFAPNYLLPAGESRTITFNADGALAAGNYYNEVWVDSVELAQDVYTFPTAVIEVLGLMDTTAGNGDSSVSSEIWVGYDSFTIEQIEITP